MTDANKLKLAKTEFALLCEMLDNRKWHYDKNEEKLTIDVTVTGDDLPMNLVIRIDVDRQLAILYSSMPFEIPKDMRVPMAVAVSLANCGIVDGGFDYDVEDGHLVFRLTASFKESLISSEVFDYMVDASCSMIDEYNDKFFMVVMQKMPIDKIVEFIK